MEGETGCVKWTPFILREGKDCKTGNVPVEASHRKVSD